MHLSALPDLDAVPRDTGGAVSVLVDVSAPGHAVREAGHPSAETARAVSLRVASGPLLRAVSVVGETPSRRLADGSLVVELGDLRSGERRRLLLRLEVSGMSAPGTVATLEVAYTDPAASATRTVSLPVSLGAVAEGGADGRVPRPEAPAQTEEARRAAGASRSGDTSRTSTSLHASQSAYSRRSGHRSPGAGQDAKRRAGKDRDEDGDGGGGGRDLGRGSGRGGRGRLIRGQQTDGGRPTPDRGAPPQES